MPFDTPNSEAYGMRHSIAVVKVATDEPKESSECLRTPDANVQVLFHLREKFVEDAREVGRGSVRGDGFPDNLRRGRSQPRFHVSAASVLCDEELKWRGLAPSTLR